VHVAYGEAVLIPVVLHHLHGRERSQGIHLGRLDIRLEALIAVRGRKEYLIGAVVLLGAAYTLKKNEHIRIDIVTAGLSQNVRNWIDVLGHMLFLIPLCLLMLWLGVPFFMRSFASGEMSSSAGGLIVWPAKLLVPLGFAMLLAQGVSELIKRVAFMRGLIDNPTPGSGGAHAPE
jgi:TRAP-type mannitol/chloroaromatic compound transport system permease small subunit